MSGPLLRFDQYLGGPDNVKVIELFPRNQIKFNYAFGSDVSAYAFSADHQTIVLDSVTYDRNTGEPKFSTTNVVGFFANVNLVGNAYIDSADAVNGNIVLTVPEQRYVGNIFPNARANVVMTVLSFQWDDGAVPPAKQLHRWAIIERWEPGVPTGNPRLETVANGGYVALGA